MHPLAGPQDVPVLNMSSTGIMRCARCRTYVNPFSEWVDGGRCSPGFTSFSAVNMCLDRAYTPLHSEYRDCWNAAASRLLLRDRAIILGAQRARRLTLCHALKHYGKNAGRKEEHHDIEGRMPVCGQAGMVRLQGAALALAITLNPKHKT